MRDAVIPALLSLSRLAIKGVSGFQSWGDVGNPRCIGYLSNAPLAKGGNATFPAFLQGEASAHHEHPFGPQCEVVLVQSSAE